MTVGARLLMTADNVVDPPDNVAELAARARVEAMNGDDRSIKLKAEG